MLGRQKTPLPLDITIAELLADMKGVQPESPEYDKMLSHLERLEKLKAEDRRRKISPDTMAIVVGNLVGILVIVAYERGHVMTTRARDYILKPN